MNTPSNIQSGQLTFTFSNLQLFETREITVTMRTNAPTDNPAVMSLVMLLNYL
jgi:PKD repeat protein